MHIAIAGAGPAGLASALALSRAGHRVTLIERDPVTVGSACEQSFAWTRKGIAHFLQPHAFLPRGRRELIALFPDVYESLIASGAYDHCIADKLQGPRTPSDTDLVYLSVRRPVIEWALRSAVLREPNLTLFDSTRITGLLLQPGEPPTVSGVVTDTHGPISADLVLDAQGRTSNLPAKLAAADCTLRVESTPSHIVYYSRYFRLHPGKQIPRGPWLIAPRGDLGYAGFASFFGDNNTIGLLLAIHAADRELRVLQHEAAWDAAIDAVPMFAPIVHPDFSAPITSVLPMGELQNTLRHYVEHDKPRVLGLIPIGDTICHTDPTFALGLTFALIHTRVLRDAIAIANSPAAILPMFWNAIYPETRERYDYAVQADNARAAMWQGEKLDYLHRDGCYPLYTMVAAVMAATRDDYVLRKTVRRIGFLDRLSTFDNDDELHRRIERIVSELMSTHRPVKPISRADLLKRTAKALSKNAVNR